MAKNETTEIETEAGDAPLIDLNDAQIKKLIARAKKRGVITWDELNEALPQDMAASRAWTPAVASMARAIPGALPFATKAQAAAVTTTPRKPWFCGLSSPAIPPTTVIQTWTNDTASMTASPAR